MADRRDNELLPSVAARLNQALPSVVDPLKRRSRRDWEQWEQVGLKPTLDLDDIQFDWVNSAPSDLDVKGAITSVTYTNTIEEAPSVTVTLRDPNHRLQREGRGMWQELRLTGGRQRTGAVDESWEMIELPDIRAGQLQLNLDGVIFRLVKVRYTHSLGEAELTFEHRFSYWLRRRKGRRSASRSKVTRAEFVRTLLKEIGPARGRYRFYCPELHVKQARQKLDTTRTDTADQSSRENLTVDTGDEGKGGGFGSGLKVADHNGKTRKATAENKRVAAKALAEADEHTEDGRARLALMEALMIEGKLTNPVGGDGTSSGPLQLLDGHLGGSTAKRGGRRDIALVTRLFLTKGFTGRGGAIKLARDHPQWSAGRIAQEVQGSGHPDRYDKVEKWAKEWLEAWGGSFGSEVEESYIQQYRFSRNKDEDSWTAIKRLADEVQWRAFIVGNTFYFMSEPQLFKRRTRYEITADDPAVIELTYDVDWGKPVSECQLQVDVDRWGTPPGSVAVLKGFGPANGRWLVTSVVRDWFSPVAEVTLKQPAKEKLEPRAEVKPRPTDSESEQTITRKGGARGIVTDAAKIAEDFGCYVGSSHRPGDTVASGAPSDHAHNNVKQAARDIGVRGINLLTGPPSPKIDAAVAAIGKQFDRDWGDGKEWFEKHGGIDTFTWQGYRIQAIWRTPKWGGHMGHLHLGARKL